MRRMLTKIKAFLSSLLFVRVHPKKSEAEEEFIKAIFECLRNVALCALVLGVGVWLHINLSHFPSYFKSVPVPLYIISGILLGSNIMYLNMKLRKLGIPRAIWLLVMAIFTALSYFLYLMLVISK